MKKKWIRWIVVLTGVVATLYGLAFCVENGSPYARRKWKDAAIVRISSHVDDPAWMEGESAELTGMTNARLPWDSWLSQDLILMTNGEWIAYSSFCRKQSFWIKDIFIGCGSDGKWYYSTYHFCVGMCAMTMDYDRPERPQPESIAAFAKRHALKEFDGKADECLEETWP